MTGNEACRPVIIETLKFLYDLEMITQKDGEIPTPEIARPRCVAALRKTCSHVRHGFRFDFKPRFGWRCLVRVPHEILFAIGGWTDGSPTNFIETYDTRADRWVKVFDAVQRTQRAFHKAFPPKLQR